MLNIHSKPGFAKGLRPADHTRAHLKFGDFLTGMPTAPLVDMAPALNYPMDSNDVAGDCVVAAWDHFRQVVTGLLVQSPENFTQDQIWAFYKTQNPDFDPNGTSDTNGPGSSADNGMNVQEFLEYLQQNAYITGFAEIDYTNVAELQAAVYIGLGVITGVVVDDIQMEQFTSGTWDYVPGASVDGGHCIPVVGYPASGATCVTWAKLINLTEDFILNQMDEAWFVVTPAHIAHPNFRDNFNLAGFLQAVSEITNGQVTINMNNMNKNIAHINEWCMATQSFEGWYPGSVSYANNNPGNLKFCGQPLATGEDANGFAVFATYGDGYVTLYEKLYNACAGLSEIFPSTDTLAEFYLKYTSDGPEVSANYAAFVAGRLGVTVETIISTLIS